MTKKARVTQKIAARLAPLGSTVLPSMTQEASSSFATPSSSQAPRNDDADQETAEAEREREAKVSELMDG